MAVRVALIGLGKMGLSHLAIARAHPDIDLAGVCDTTDYVLAVLNKYTGISVHSDYRKMIESEKLDAVIVAAPSRFHGEMVGTALERGLHVFCEKPFCLDAAEGARLAAMAREKGLVNQVGYHYRFVGAFNEAKRLIDAGALGRVHHVRAEAYGPVVLRPKNSTWRARKTEGGGCLYDYACHAIDLVTYLVGTPGRVSGTVLNSVFSRDVEDEVYSTFYFPDGATGQLAANWSDDSHRKMSTKISIWGENGRLVADRQEVQVYLREVPAGLAGYREGWTVRYTTELTEEAWYYLRGEEYSAQIDHFVHAILDKKGETLSSFTTASETDRVVAMMLADAGRAETAEPPRQVVAAANQAPRRGLFGMLGGRARD